MITTEPSSYRAYPHLHDLRSQNSQSQLPNVLSRINETKVKHAIPWSYYRKLRRIRSPPEEKSSSVAVPPGNAQLSSDIPMWQRKKRGAKCCGCCCDYRRAVIMIAIMTLFFSFFTVPGVILDWSLPGVSSANIDNDIKEALEKIEEGDKNVRMALFIVSTVTSIASLIGAFNFNASLVACNVAGYIGKSFSSAGQRILHKAYRGFWTFLSFVSSQ